jgi:SAM-dependent methyltransferase
MLSMPDAKYESLSSLLPRMAPDEIQDNWTGAHGYSLLRQTLDFVRSVNFNFADITKRSLRQAQILDFGCGYGRIARLMYYFTAPNRLFCVDPWDESIRLCKECNMLGNFFISDYVLRSLPFENRDFDLIYCFSVFTHLSEKTATAALQTLRRYVAPGGLLVLTVRPEEYWTAAQLDSSCVRSRQEILREHREKGFAFVPHRRAPIEGEVTYGDTSFTISWLVRSFPMWRFVTYDRSLDDPLQVVLFLSPC